MKLRLGILALVVTLAACAASAASSRTATPAASRCGPAAATTLASSRLARAYKWRGGIFGCAFAVGRSFRLGNAARSLHERRVSPVTVAGDDAAYGLSSFGVDTVSAALVVRRLTDGKQLRDFSATARNVVEGVQSVRALAIKSDGAVAWIGEVHSIVGAGGRIEVRAADASAAADRLLDSASAIDPTSLRLHGSTLTWQHGGKTRHATLH